MLPALAYAVSIVGILSACLIGNASAADFDVHRTPNGIEIKGIIVPGDTAKFQAIYEPIAKTFTNIGDEQSVRIFFDSPGGSYIEGLLLGRYLHRSGLGTYIRRGDACFSACAMAFLGGT